MSLRRAISASGRRRSRRSRRARGRRSARSLVGERPRLREPALLAGRFEELEQRLQQEGVVLQEAVELRAAVVVGAQQAPVRIVAQLAQVAQRRTPRSATRRLGVARLRQRRARRRRARAIISAFQVVRRLSSSAGRTGARAPPAGAARIRAALLGARARARAPRSTFRPGCGWSGSAKLPCSRRRRTTRSRRRRRAPSALAQLATRPHVEAALDALGVGVERAVEAALGAAHLAQRPVERVAGRPRSRRGSPASLPAVQIGAREQRVVVEHLLEVRHRPGRVDAVAAKPPPTWSWMPAGGHRVAASPSAHRPSRRAHSRNSSTEACGNFGAPAEAAVDARRRSRAGSRPRASSAPRSSGCVRGPQARRRRAAARAGARRRRGSPRRRSRQARRSPAAPASTPASRGAAPAGSRCRRRTGSCSGVRNTFSGQPPWPVIAWTASM